MGTCVQYISRLLYKSSPVYNFCAGCKYKVGIASVTSLLPAQRTRTQQLNYANIRLVWSVRPLRAPLSWMIASTLVECAPQNTVSRSIDVCLPRVFALLANLYTDADQASHASLALPETPSHPHLVRPPVSQVSSSALSLVGPGSASSCSIIVIIEPFRLHLLVCVHAHNTPNKARRSVRLLLGDRDLVHHREESRSQLRNKQCGNGFFQQSDLSTSHQGTRDRRALCGSVPHCPWW